MENNIEKAKFVSQYWGQRIAQRKDFPADKATINEFIQLGHDNWILELKPLSSITDEDAGVVASIMRHNKRFTRHEIDKNGNVLIVYEDNELLRIYVETIEFSTYDDIDNYNTHYSESGFYASEGDFIAVVDYLRSKGYALPYMGLSVEEQVSRGWVKLKEN